MKVYIYNQNTNMSGRVCNKSIDDIDLCDVTLYNKHDLPEIKRKYRSMRAENSNELFEAKVLKTVIEYFDGEVRNLRCA